MHQTVVLIHQARPSHQILLHQALNAQGVFAVRISATTAELDALLGAERRPDLLILDHAMPTRAGRALLARLAQARALLFVGQPAPQRFDLAQEARKQGLWVLAELPWPLSMPRLQRALQSCRRGIDNGHSKANFPLCPRVSCSISHHAASEPDGKNLQPAQRCTEPLSDPPRRCRCQR